MHVNTDFWGSESEWLTPSNTALQGADVKTINFSTRSLPDYWSSGYNATGERSYNLYDPPKPEQTPTAWGIGKLSALSNPLYAFAGYSNFSTGSPYSNANVTPYTRDMRLDKNTPLPMCPQCFSYGVSDAVGWSRRVYPNVTSINTNNCVCGGVTKFNYQNIVVYPKLKVCKKIPHSTSYKYGIQERTGYVTISDYFDGNNPIKDEYPYIMAVIIDSWYMGEQPIYNNGVYVSGERSGYIGNNFSLRFNEPLKGTEYNIPKSMRYNGNVVTRSPQVQKDFYTIYPVSLYNSCLSGYYYNRIGYLGSMQNDTIADDIEKAWTLSNNGNYPVVAQNGHYVIEAIQEYDGTNYTRPYIVVALWENATKEEVLRDVAFLGFWFSEDVTTARRALTGENCNDSKMHIPVFDSKGVTTGDWKSGTDAALEPNAKWGDPFNDSPYNPQDSDNNDFGDLDSSIPIRGNNTAGLKLWVVSQSDLYNINAYLNGTYLPDITQSTADFKGSNPQEYIVSIQQYPFSLPHFRTKDYIHIGKLNTGVEGYPFVYDQGIINSISIVDFGSLLIPYYFQDFRDFESTIVIQLPFIGAYELDPRVYVGHTVSLKYNIDYTTGSVCAMIYRDNLIVETYTGNISISVPLFASNMGAYQNTLASLQFAVDQSKTKQIAGIAATALSIGGALAAIPTGGMSALAAAGIAGGLISGASSMVSGLIQQQELEYKIDHTQPHTASVSTASAANSFLLDDRARLLIYRPRMLNYDDAVYSHTVGNACCLTGVVGDFEGLIKCGNVDLSGIPATADEIKAIGDALASGVYV